MEPDSRMLVYDMILPQKVGKVDFPAAALDIIFWLSVEKRGPKRDLKACLKVPE